MLKHGVGLLLLLPALAVATDLCATLSSDSLLVVILSYERSGSTFLGEVFNQNNKVFYFYEPLRDLHKTLQFPRLVFDSENNTHVTTTRLQNTLACNLKDLGCDVINDFMLRRKSRSLDPYFRCRDTAGFSHECLSRHAVPTCLRMRTRVIKTVRSTMESIAQLLEKHRKCVQNFRVVHLLRDPRAQIMSLTRSARFDLGRSRAQARRTCVRAVKDVLLRRHLAVTYPNVFIPLRYEDLAARPQRTVKELYRKLDITLPTPVLRWVQENTRSSSSREDIFGTRRSDSARTALAWRRQAPVSMVSAVDDECVALYDLVGYRAVRDESHLRDLNSSLVSEEDQMENII